MVLIDMTNRFNFVLFEDQPSYLIFPLYFFALYLFTAECDVPVPGFFHFLAVLEQIGTRESLGTGIRKIWYREKVSELVSETLVPEKSLGTGTGTI